MNVLNVCCLSEDIFCYDPEAAPGEKFSVFASTPIQRFDQSTALLIPDGRTLLMGNIQASFTATLAYEHRAEAFTPPWLLDGTPRPVISG
jgi:hypothetical protein